MGPNQQSREALQQLAEHEQLTYCAEGKLPAGTALLRKDGARLHDIVGGDLPGGAEGVVCGLTYQVPQGENTPPKDEHATIFVTSIPESIGLIPVLTAHDAKDRSWGEIIAGAGGILPFFAQIEFESIKFNATYRVGVVKRQDENWVRQLFSPSFIDYLAERVPEGCYFDLWGGMLTVALHRAVESEEELRRFCEVGAHIADRIRSEALENEDVAPSSLTDGMWGKAMEAQNKQLDEVKFNSPPTDVKSAAKKYRGLARRNKWGWLLSLGIPVIVAILPALLIGGLAGAVTDDSGGDGVRNAVIGFAVVFVPLFLWMFMSLRRSIVRGTSQSYGLQTFMRGYAANHGLQEMLPVEVQIRHMRLQPPKVPARAFSGSIPKADRQGELIVFETDHNKGLSAGSGLFTKTGLDPTTPVIRLLPAGADDKLTSIGGFFVGDVKGLREPEHVAQARERMRAHIGKDLADRYGVIADPDALDTVEKLITPGLQQALDNDGKPLYLTLAGGDLLVFSPGEKVDRWNTETIDDFCQSAGRVAREVDAAAR